MDRKFIYWLKFSSKKISKILFRAIVVIFFFINAGNITKAQNNAVFFDGISDDITLADNSILNFGSNDFTISFWITLSDLNLIHDGLFARNDFQWLAMEYNHDGDRRLNLWIDDNGSGWAFNNLKPQKTDWVQDQWYNIAVSRDNNTINIFIDGIISASSAYTLPIYNPLGVPLHFGRSQLVTRNHHGKMDDIRIWDYALSEVDLQSSMYSELTGLEPGLVGYWNLNEPSGSTAADLTSNGNDFTLNYDASFTLSDSPTNQPLVNGPFTPVSPTGLAYNVIITDVNIDGGSLPKNSQIGIYDGATCVGAGLFDLAGNVQIITWKEDIGQGFAGFTAGNPISIKVRTNWFNNIEIFDAVLNFTDGNGNFGTGSFSAVSLSIATGLVPDISLSQSLINFNAMPVGSSDIKSFIILNSGNTNLNVTNISVGSPNYVFSKTTTLIAPGSEDTVYVTFTPTAALDYELDLSITSDDPNKGLLTIRLNGTGLPIPTPQMTLTPNILFFDGVAKDSSFSKRFNILNKGNGALVVSNITSSDGAFIVNGPTSFSLAQFENRDIEIAFSPASVGYFNANVTITDNNGNHTVVVSGFSSNQHFVPVKSTGKPYNIIIKEINVDSKNAFFGDEIAVFDNSLCVGNTIIDGGKSLKCANFGDYISIPAITLPASYTLEAWVMFPLPSIGNYRTLFQNGGNYHHVLISDAGEIGVYNAGWYTSGYNINGLTSGWHHVSAIGTGSTTSFFIDGNFVGTSATKCTQTVRYFGNYVGGGQNIGISDEYRIWNFARTGTQIKADMNRLLTGNENGLLGYWNFNDATLSDLSIYGRNASFANAANIINMGAVPGTISLIAWEKDPGQGLAGFTNGNTMSFKLWTELYTQDMELTTVPTYEVGDGTFGYGQFSVLSLVANTAIKPNIVFSKSKLYAGQVEVNKSVIDSFTIYNTGNALLHIDLIENSTSFSVDATTADIPLDDSLVVRVTFSPLSSGSHVATLTINTNDPDTTSVPYLLEGFAIPPGIPDIGLSTGALEMGGVIFNQSLIKVFNVINTGTAPLIVSNITSNSSYFTVSPVNFTLNNTNDNKEINVTFNPNVRGLYTGTITVTSNGGTKNVSLRGVSYDGHFNAVQSTGIPYSIVVESADLFNNIEIGDEIAVYDDTLCVGSSAVLQNINNIQVVAWQEDGSQGLNGFTSGNTITFKVWSKINGFDSEFKASANFVVGDGNFGFGQFSVVNLVFSTPQIEANPVDVFVALIEPDSTDRTIQITNNGDENLYIEVEKKYIANSNMLKNSALFDGSNDYINTGTINIGSQWTIEAWVRPSSLPVGRRTIFGGWGGCADWAITMNNGYYAIGLDPPAICTETFTSSVLAVVDEWAHVVVSSNGDSAKLYINGKYIAGRPVLTNYIGYTGTRIGGEVCCAGNNFPGLIDEVRLWNYTRTEVEIQNDMYVELTGLESGLVSLWNFNDGTADDLTGAHNGTFTNGAVISNINAPLFTWLEVSPIVDTIPSLQSNNINLHFNSTGLIDGLYEAKLYLYNNTLNGQPLVVPVSLNVTGNPQVSSSSDTLNYGQLNVGDFDTLTLMLTNIGSKDLVIDTVKIKNSLISDFNLVESFSFPITLSPVSQLQITVVFNPDNDGSQLDTLLVTSNDVTDSIYNIILMGNGLTPPDIDLSITSWSYTLNSGEYRVDTLQINNRGQAILDYNLLESIPWLSLLPVSGSIPVTDSIVVNMNVSAIGIYAGNYLSTMYVQSNDPNKSSLDFVFNLTVLGNPEILTAGSVNIGDVFINNPKIYPLQISNIGTDTLFIDSINISENIFIKQNVVNYILPGQSDTLYISFTPNLDVLYSGILTIYSDALTGSVWSIGIQGRGIKPQDISVSPLSFNKTLTSGESKTYNLSITNSGGRNLDYTLALDNLAGNSLLLDGNGDYINILSSPALNPDTAITIEAWIYLEDNTQEYILAKELSTFGNYRFFINASGKLQLTLNTNKTVTSSSVVGIGTWTHVAASFDGSMMNIYINGVLNNSVKYNKFTIISNGDNLKIGRSFASEFFNGMIDEVRIWDVYKNASEIKTLMDESLNGNEEGLVLYYKFDEPGGNITNDNSTFNHQGTFYGNSTRAVSGVLIDDFISISGNAGTLGANSSRNIIVTLKAIDLFADNYIQNITINSNDIDEPEISVPVTMNINGNPTIEMLQDSLIFNDTYFGFADTITLIVKNIGAEHLVLSNWSHSNSAFIISNEYTDVLPYSEKNISVMFAPTFGGIITDTISFSTNDILNPNIVISLKGLGVEPPEISLSDTILDFGPIIVGNFAMASVSIKNTGISPLDIAGITSSNPLIFPFTNISPVTILASDSAIISLTYLPLDYIDYIESLTFSTNIGMAVVELMGSGITPGDDVGVVSLLSPYTTCAMTDTSIVQIRIRNFGSVPQTGFNVGYSINGQPAVIENVGTLTIPVGSSRNYTFTTLADMRPLGNYIIDGFTVLGGDLTQTNDTLTLLITNHPELDMAVSENKTICYGENVLLNAASELSSFVWSTGSTNSYINVSPSNDLTYTVTATNIYGCTDIDTINVTVLPLPVAPVISASGTTSICLYDSVELQSDIGGIVWNTAETSMIIYTHSAGNFYAVNTDTNFCSATSNIITVNNELTPNLFINGATTLCKGDFTQLTVENAVSYLWSTGDTVKTINVSPEYDSSFAVIMTTAGACSFIDSVFITVIDPTPPEPVAAMLPPDASLDVFKPIRFSWSPGLNASNYDIYVWNEIDPQPITPVIANLSTINYVYSATSLTYGNTYKWMVSAKNSCYTTDGPEQTFALRHLPDLIIENIQTPPTIYSGQNLTTTWETKNIGLGSTNSEQWRDAIYLSLDSLLTGDDIFIGYANNLAYLVPNQSYSNTATFPIPTNIIGNYYVLVDADYSSWLNESNESNNYGFDKNSALLSISIQPKSDLIVNTIGIPTSIFSGNTISVNYEVKNTSAANAQGSTTYNHYIFGAYYTEQYWMDAIYISAEPTFQLSSSTKLSEVFVGLRSEKNPDEASWYSVPDYLQQDSVYQRIVQVVVPYDYMGTYYIYVFTDLNQSVNEDVENNNVFKSMPINVILSPPPDLAVESITVPANAKSSETITIDYTGINQGANAPRINNWKDKIYISTLDTFNSSLATLMATEYISNGMQLNPNDTYARSVSITLPNGIDGAYYVYVQIDCDNQVFEYTYDGNNILRSTQAIDVTLAPYPDLNVESIVLPDSSLSPNVQISWVVINNEPQIALANWTDRVYISIDSVWNPANATKVTDIVHNLNLVTGASYNQAANLNLTGISDGIHYFYVYTDINNEVYEHNFEGNNVLRAQMYYEDTTTTPSGGGGNPLPNDTTFVNLAITNITSSPTGFSGSSINIAWTAENIGTRVTKDYWYDYVYLSVDSVLDASDALLDYHTHNGVIAPTQSYSVSRAFTLPDGVSGTYYLFLVIDGQVRNSSDTVQQNNYAANQIAITLTPPPDLVVNAFSVAPALIAGQMLKMPFTIRNNGVGDTRETFWQENTYLSTTPDLQAGTYVQIGTFNHSGKLNSGAIYSDTISMYIPSYLAGYYYFIIKTDGFNSVYEYNKEGNNIDYAIVQITIPDPSDLIISTIAVPPLVNLGEDVNVIISVKNIGANPAIGNLSDAAYFSKDTIFNSTSDKLLKTKQGYVYINPGDSIIKTLSDKMPGVVPGGYWGIGRTNLLNSVVESDLENNITFTDDTMVVSVNELFLSIPDTFGLDIGNMVYYKVNVDKDLDMRITLRSNQANGSNEIYVAYNRVPSTNDFDFLFDSPNEVNQNVLVPSTQKGNYYILVKTPTNYHGLQNAVILAEALPFSILEIEPDTVGNGVVTTRINGAGFRDYTRFYLLNQDSTVLDSAKKVILENSMQVQVKWDFTNITLGTYHVKAYNNDTAYFIKANGMTIEESTGYLIDYNYVAPNLIRANGRASYSFYYRNIGNVDMPFIKGDYTVPTYANLINMSTIGKVLKRSELVADTSLGSLDNWVDFDDFKHIPILAKNIAPGNDFTVSLVFREFGNSSVFPMRVRAYGFSTEGYLKNQLNLLEGTRLNMYTDPDIYGVNQNPEIMNLLNNKKAWRDSVLAYHFNMGLLKPEDTIGFNLECVDCNVGFDNNINQQSNFTFDPGLSSGTEKYIKTSFDAGEDYMWEINNANGMAGVNPGWDLIKSNGRIDITATQQNPFVIHIASINYDNESDYLAGWYPAENHSWPIAIASDGIFGFDSIKFALDLTKFIPYNNIYGGHFSLSLQGADTLLLVFNGDYSLTNLDPLPEYPVIGLPDEGIPCGSADNLGQISCEYIFSTLECSASELACFSSFVLESTNPLEGPKGVAVALFGTSTCGLGISSCTNSLIDQEFISPSSVNGIDLLGCSNIQTSGSSTLINCTGQYICNQVVKSCDPNDIIGPRGVGEGRYVAIEETLPYMIRFENDSSFATTAAQRVTITQQLDDNIDPLSFRVKDFGYADYIFNVPFNTASYFNTLDLPDELGYDLEVTAGIDISNNEAFWVFQTIDPRTGLSPTDPLIGFLAVNDSVGSGEGFVSYTVNSSFNSQSGDSILAEALIVFDINAPIITPEIFNRIDKDKPISFVNTLPSFNDSLVVPIDIVGFEEANGSGINHYKLFVSESNGKFKHIGDYTPDAVIPFLGKSELVYKYFSIAVDNVGHVEPMKYFEEAETMVKLSDIKITPILNHVSCYGLSDASIDLLVMGGEAPYQYLWSTGSINQNLTNIDAGIYTVTITDIQDSTAVDSFEIIQPPQLSVNLGNDTSIFEGNSLILNASPIYDSYLWSDSSFNSTMVINVTSGTYWVRVAFNSCFAYDSVDVVIIPPLYLGDSIFICEGEFALIDAGPGYDTYNWSNGDISQSISVNTAGKYSVIVTKEANSTSDTVEVFVNPAPVVNLGADISLNNNETATLSVSVGYQSYLWSDMTTNNSLVVDASSLSDGVYSYSVSVTNSYNCESSDLVLVTVGTNKINIDFDNTVISMYPNPTHDNVNIQVINLQENILIEITNVEGQLVYQHKLNKSNSEKTHRIDLFDMTNGVYFIKLKGKDFEKNERIVKY